MCGRFVLVLKKSELKEFFPDFDFQIRDVQPRYNVAPGQPVVTAVRELRNVVTFTQWGLVPAWMRDPSQMDRPLINARSESVQQKPAFRNAFKRMRCLIPATGFYEWKKVGQKKQPWFFRRRDRAPFAFAGLWEEWEDHDGGVMLTSTILTTTPNRVVRPVHPRMPVVLKPECWEEWLDHQYTSAPRLQSFLKPAPDEEWEGHEISFAVNNPNHDAPDCIEPLQQSLL